MQNLALLNSLWDGMPHRVERKTSESFTIEGARLTMGLAAQPETVRQFIDGSKGLARGSGFAARFLIAAPASTQGTRIHKPSGPQPARARFAERLRELLAMTGEPIESGGYTFAVLEFDAVAYEAWRAFHDDVEKELRAGGELAEVRDVASKAADNVARIAALFHLYECGPSGRICADLIARAAQLVAWHLFQARAFLDNIAAPREVHSARKLDAWLIDYCRMSGANEIERRTVQNKGPNPIRTGAALDAALATLAEAGRARLVERGRRKLIAVNPALLAAEP
jgi:putative DNA primase/helicase